MDSCDDGSLNYHEAKVLKVLLICATLVILAGCVTCGVIFR